MTRTDSPPPASAEARPRRSLADTRRNVVRVAGLAAVLALVLAFVAVVGARQGWLSLAVASGGVMRTAVPTAAVLAVVFGLIGLVLAFVAKPREGLVGSLSAIALGALTFAAWSVATASDAKAPPIHDVATDWTEPLMASPQLTQLRGDKANPVEAAPVLAEGPRGAVMSRPVAMINRETCPAAAPVTLTASAAQGYEKLKAAVTADKMALVTDDPLGGALEATVARGAYGVRDDLIGRVRPEGAGARIDLRSISRTGDTDGGANCARITRLRARLVR